MIKTELLENNLVRTYSDAGMKIHGGYPEGDYNEAIDPVSIQRTYTETDIPIEDEISDSEALYIITDGEHGKDGDEHEVE